MNVQVSGACGSVGMLLMRLHGAACFSVCFPGSNAFSSIHFFQRSIHPRQPSWLSTPMKRSFEYNFLWEKSYVMLSNLFPRFSKFFPHYSIQDHKRAVHVAFRARGLNHLKENRYGMYTEKLYLFSFTIGSN